MECYEHVLLKGNVLTQMTSQFKKHIKQEYSVSHIYITILFLVMFSVLTDTHGKY